MPIAPRQTFLIKSGPAHDPERLHLHVVCLGVDAEGNTLLVSVASYTHDNCDSTCVIEPHEHKFLKHKSYVDYRKAKIEQADEIEKGIAAGRIIRKEDMNTQTFLKVRNGVGRSERTLKDIKRYFKRRMQGE